MTNVNQHRLTEKMEQLNSIRESTGDVAVNNRKKLLRFLALKEEIKALLESEERYSIKEIWNVYKDELGVTYQTLARYISRHIAVNNTGQVSITSSPSKPEKDELPEPEEQATNEEDPYEKYRGSSNTLKHNATPKPEDYY